MKKAALLFGSFNPLHKGHLAIASFILSMRETDEVRLVVTPKNPFGKKDLADAAARLENTRRAVSESGLDLKVSDVEFSMEEPLYTIKTLDYLKKTEPDWQHILIIGGDNLESLQRWYEWRELATRFEIWVYPRTGSDCEVLKKRYDEALPGNRIRILDGELHDISSTMIREGEKRGEDMSSYKC